MIRVICIEDHLLVREAWKDLLSMYKDISVVGEADNVIDGYALVQNLRPDIILMDINLKHENATGLIQQICSTIPNPRIIVVSMHEEYMFIKKLFSVGIMGYVSKFSSKADFVGAIRKVYAGEKFMCGIVQQLFLQQALHSESNDLSLRELDILRCIAQGFSNKDIGTQLKVSVKTVEGHKTKIYKKLNAKSIADLIVYAKTKGLDI